MPQGASTTDDYSCKGPEMGCLFPSHKESIVIDPASPSDGWSEPPPRAFVGYSHPETASFLNSTWYPIHGHLQNLFTFNLSLFSFIFSLRKGFTV